MRRQATAQRGPATAVAAPPIKARRDSPSRAYCDDDPEPGATGHPLLPMPNTSMVTAPRPSRTQTKTLTPHQQPVQSPAEMLIRRRRSAGAGLSATRYLGVQVIGAGPPRGP